MSQENVKLVCQAIDAFNEVGMAEAGLRFFDDDAVFEEPPEQPSPTVAEGRDAAIRTFAQFEEAWEEHRSETEEIRVLDDERVLVLSIEHFRGRDGIEISQPCGNLFTLRGGKIVRYQAFWERATALKAAGLSE
jgi:ketosteroid isomerase-like protein